MLKCVISLVMCLILANIGFGQDCPGGVPEPLAAGSYKWYWGENVSTVEITRTLGGTNLDESTRKQIIRSAISSALNWQLHTYGVISFSEGDESDADALKIEFESWGPPSEGADEDRYGNAPAGQFKILINSDVWWTDNTSLEGTRHPDIYTVLIHEMGHIFGVSHAASTSTSVMYYNNGNFRRLLTICDKSTVEEAYNPEYSITIQNNFNDANDYVNIYDSQNSKSVKSAPYNHVERESTWPWDMEAENQNFTESTKTYYMQFQNWTGYQFGSPGNERQDIPKVDDGNYFANFHKTFDIDFTNKYGTSGTGGDISVNSSQVSSPTSNYQVKEYNTINAASVNQTIDGVYFTFSSWTKDGGQTIPASELTSGSPPFKPVDHTTYECNLTGTPVWTNRNLHTNSTAGQYIKVEWNEHPSSDVNYKIYRKIKVNGVMGSEIYRATVTHGTTEWTDNIQVADGQTTHLVYYDVRAYYTPNGTYSTEDYDVTDYTWTEENIQTIDENEYQTAEADENALAEEIVAPTETTLGNFPNPFNPTTNINYSLTEAGFVSLKVYNVLGKEVATLVNESKAAGEYSVSFNASNLPSGVYIYTLQTNTQTITRKMLMMK